MQIYFLVAGLLALLTGVIHSVLGEIRIFRPLRSKGLIPTIGVPPLREGHIRIIWATWHLGSVFGWAFAGVLLRLAFPIYDFSLKVLVLNAIACAYLGGGLLVLIGTKGRHPGWVALLIVAVCTWFASNAP